MDTRTGHTARRRLWTAALLLAVVALTLLAVAGPAVAKPGHAAPSSGATLSAAGAIAVIVLAACGALALVLLASLMGQREQGAERAEIETVTHARRDDHHRVAA